MRLNLWRRLVLRHPSLRPADEAAFDELLAATAPGGLVDYSLPQPKWWFLHHLTQRGHLLHGSNEREIDEFRARQTFDAHGAPIEAVFASDDAIWPLYFAVVNRPVAQSYINWCEHVGTRSRYLFSIGSDPRDPRSWTSGTIYVLPRDTFAQTPKSREFVSPVAVSPRARLAVDPEDFPFLHWTLGHRRGETARRVSIRHALTLRRPRRL